MDELTEHNLRLLKEELKEKGFPESVLPALEEKIRSEYKVDFYLLFETNIDNKPVKGNLYFLDTDTPDAHRLLSFSLDFGKDTDVMVSQANFLVGHGYDISMREAYNLMDGRWVYKEPPFDPEKKGYWVGLNAGDVSSYYAKLEYQASDFRVEQAITDSPLGYYLNPEQKKELVASLKEGNRPELNIDVMGVPKKVWAEAAPVFQKIRLSDAKGNKVQLKEPSKQLGFGTPVKKRSK